MNLNNSFDLVRHVEGILFDLDRTTDQFTISHSKRELHVMSQCNRDQSYGVHSFYWDRAAETPSGDLCDDYCKVTREEALHILRVKSRFIMEAL